MSDISKLTQTVLDIAKELERVGYKAHETFPNGSDWRHMHNLADNLCHLGITPNMHVGRGDEMKGSDDTSRLLALEWFAGDLLEIIRTHNKEAINIWLNRVDRYT